MSAISFEPGQEITQDSSASVSDIPEVLAVKNTVNRAARKGFADPEASGEATAVVQLLDGVGRFAEWWKSATPTQSLKYTYLRARSRRKVTFLPHIQQASGTFSAATSRGRSKGQKTRWWSSIATGSSVYTITAKLMYADVLTALPTAGITLTNLSVTAITQGVTPGSVISGANVISFTLPISTTPKSILLRITGIESRGYDGFSAAELVGAPAMLQETVELILPA
jgi:hypothetical protein